MSNKPLVSAATVEELALMWLSNQDISADTPKQLAEKFINAYDDMLTVIVIDKPKE